jgi:hypothetical protein
MIYDRERAARMLRVVLDVTTGALDAAARPGGEPSLRPAALAAEKAMRTLAAKGDVDAMHQEYLRLLHDETFGPTLDRLHMRTFESELYRFVKESWHRE